MGGNTDLFGIHEQALLLRAKRSELLAANLANANTPNYKARDFNFNEVLAGMEQRRTEGDLAASLVSHEAHFDLSPEGSLTDPVADNLYYRVPTQPSLDGNTVNSQHENSEFLDNSIHYQASLAFMNSRIQSILGALRGE